MRLIRFALLFGAFSLSPKILSAKYDLIPIDRMGYRTGELVQTKRTEWFIAGFKQEKWFDAVIVGDRVCLIEKGSWGYYFSIDEEYAWKHRIIRKKPQDRKNP